MRHAVLLLLLCACSSLSSEERDTLADHQRNAKHYFEGGNLGQAMGQIDKGLALEPDDYVLNSLKGAILLKTSASSQGTDHRRLDQATALLAQVYDQRAANRHEPYLLFDYALALQKQGRRHLGEALRLRGEAKRNPTQAALQGEADRQQVAADEKLAEAGRLLGVLLERGELLRLTHYHLLLIAQDRRDDKAFLDHAKAYLVQMANEQEAAKKDIDKTATIGFEQARSKDLRALRTEEMEVCELLADHYFDRKQYKEAIAMLNRVLEIDPGRSANYYNRGRALVELGQTEPAKADFRKFLATTNLPSSSDKVTAATMALDR